eukprot:COSAG04_NODE_1014_length_8762_cov_31.342145_9_plen_81_part_00
MLRTYALPTALQLPLSELVLVQANEQRAEQKYATVWYQPEEQPKWAALQLRFTLGLGVTAVIPPGDMRLVGLARAQIAEW